MASVWPIRQTMHFFRDTHYMNQRRRSHVAPSHSNCHRSLEWTLYHEVAAFMTKKRASVCLRLPLSLCLRSVCAGDRCAHRYHTE